jgi:hypothetical protein
MAAFTTAALVGAAVVGTAATIKSVNQQKQAARQQEDRLDQQETEAKELAKVKDTREDTGATVKLGSDEATAAGVTSVGGGTGTSRSGSTRSRIGLGARPSSRVGL